MTSLRDGPARRLRQAIVLGTTEEECTVFAEGERMVVPYASAFPKPRTERVAPGHLVALGNAVDARRSLSGAGSTPSF
jgi:hypothetical protein